jgi:hypothetical protein
MVETRQSTILSSPFGSAGPSFSSSANVCPVDSTRLKTSLKFRSLPSSCRRLRPRARSRLMPRRLSPAGLMATMRRFRSRTKVLV